ncbi:MAG: KAP family NTPase [candidate division KSB1 bacterium]|nr:KAP family NTPase [candidate division KSB1 bacterium]
MEQTPQYSYPIEIDDQEKFLAILNNRNGPNQRSAMPPREHGFVVLARKGNSLKPLQALCFDSRQTSNTCLTARYRLQPGAVFGTLFWAFLSDLKKIQSGALEALLGDLFPIPSDTRWHSLLSGPLSSFLTSVPSENEGVLTLDLLEQCLRLLSDETTLSRGMRLVLFAEVSTVSDDELAMWMQAYRALMRRLPKRFGLVLLGAPADFRLPTAEPQFLEIELRDDGAGERDSEGERVYKYKLPPIHSDRAAREDRLGIDNYAEALARFVLHPQTLAPLTIGIHGEWGKGKSSFMELIDIALVKWTTGNRAARTQKLADLQAAIEKLQADLENASDPNRDKLRQELAKKTRERTQLWQQMQAAAEKEVVSVRFNAWQFEDAQQIWAGLASVVSERLEGMLSGAAQFWMRIVYAWNKRRAELLLNLFLPLVVVLLAAVYLALGGAAQLSRVVELMPAAKDLPALGGLLKYLVPGSSFLFLLWFAAWRIWKVALPVSKQVLGYMQLPSYREQMGYQHQVMDDLRFVNRTLQRHRPNCKVVIYIDDLDRCSEEKIMDILQAINLILGGSEFFVFLGMDTEMIYRAIRVHYRKNQKDEPLPEEFPENYLRKIIQLSFHLPAMPPEKRFAFVSTLFSAEARRDLEQRLAAVSKPEQSQQAESAEAVDGAWPFDLALVQKPVSQLMKEVEDTAEELAAFRDYQAFLEDNPREMKRLVNVHRLVKILLQRPEMAWPPLRQRKLVKWVIFCSNWSELIDDVFAQARTTPDAVNCLDKLLEKLEVPPEHADDYDRLREFARHKDVLSSQDIDDDFSLAACISHMVQDSPAPIKKMQKQYGYLFPLTSTPARKEKPETTRTRN